MNQDGARHVARGSSVLSPRSRGRDREGAPLAHARVASPSLPRKPPKGRIIACERARTCDDPAGITGALFLCAHCRAACALAEISGLGVGQAPPAARHQRFFHCHEGPLFLMRFLFPRLLLASPALESFPPLFQCPFLYSAPPDAL